MQKYNICYSLDSYYVEQFCVSVVSILENTLEQDNINFYILDGGLTKDDKLNIESLKKIKDFNLHYIKIDSKDFEICPLLKDKDENHKDYHVTLPGYFRFKLPELLSNLDKILYLDCDVIVRSSLNELFDVDLKNKSAAMVEDVDASKELERLGVEHYYNSGVMLINLAYWRENQIQSKLFEYVKNNIDKIVWQDQDVINAVLAGSVVSISNKWNYQYFLYESIEAKELNACVILHLAGRFKPWIIPFEHFIYDCYYYYLLMTPFKNKVFEYRLNGSGRFLKDNVGGSVTNIRLNASDEYVYTWFLKVEKKLTEETDVKLSKLYDDILKNYDYANDIAKGVDDKVKTVYEEITKCYEYTNDLTQKLKEKNSTLDAQTDEKITKVYKEISKNYDCIDNLNSQFDEKISKVYKEITQNYDYTNNLVEELKKSGLGAANVSEAISHRLTEVYAYVNNQLSKAFSELRENNSLVETRLDEKLNSDNYHYNEHKISIDNLWNELNNKTDVAKINELEEEYNSKISTLQSFYESKISNLKSDFENQMKEQRMNYEAKIQKIEYLLQKMEQESKEEKKSFIQKLIKK